jgi:hypothetical protein
MVVDRKPSKGKYVAAFFITSLIFLLGLTIGLVVDNERVRALENANRMQNLDYESIQFQYLFMNSLESSGNTTCVVLQKTIENSMKDLSKSLEDIQNYDKESNFNDDEFDLISRKYILDNLKYWLFAERAKKECDFDAVTILYFHTSSNCPNCPDQGTVLTYYKEKLQDRILIFPIDISSDAPEVNVLRARYNITELPSIVVDDKVYVGLVNRKDIANIICRYYDDKPDFCEK